MQYRLAGASYRSIAAEAHRGPGQRVCRRERDQRRASHEEDPSRLETHGLGRRDSGVGGTAARDGDAARRPDGARERPGGSGVLEGAVAVREGPRAGGPTGYRDDGTAVPFRCRIVTGTRPAASRCRGTRRTRRTRGRCRECVCPTGAGGRSFGVLCCSSTTTYRYFWTAPRSAVAPAE